MSESLSKVYYKGLPSQPRLIATTKPITTGPEAYSVLKELRELGDHSLADFWSHGLATRLRHGLNTLGANWTSIDAVRIAEVGEDSSTAIAWIGVEVGALGFEEGSAVAGKCRAFVDGYGVQDYHVEIRESRVVRQAGNRFLDPVPFSDPTFTACDAYTATLGIPISSKNRPWVEGTAGLFISAGGDDEKVYSITARHVPLPLDEDDNKEYDHRNMGQAREDGQEHAVMDAKERAESVEGMEDDGSVAEHTDAERDLKRAELALERLKAFRHEIATSWKAEEHRVFGQLVWAPPIALSTEPGQYTLDLAVVQVDAGMPDSKNFQCNVVNIGKKYTRQEFMDKLVSLNNATLRFPASRLVKIHGEVSETDIKEPMVVFKNGGKSGMTLGRANGVSSYTRTCLGGQYRESRECPVFPIDSRRARFLRRETREPALLTPWVVWAGWSLGGWGWGGS
ncbi:hypothetical protein OE88DRAFT_1737634 [Heliocybe sulcata]|uniref:Uncharacterized protein n=1 Tax=Heliocybe sulcata TaxID=5364 RepID=A0A5C3MXI1_9AGAM|nr:hypothetical protein OE88DRAFT_1737634 [Heliocybe sulcata]